MVENWGSWFFVVLSRFAKSFCWLRRFFSELELRGQFQNWGRDGVAIWQSIFLISKDHKKWMMFYNTTWDVLTGFPGSRRTNQMMRHLTKLMIQNGSFFKHDTFFGQFPKLASHFFCKFRLGYLVFWFVSRSMSNKTFRLWGSNGPLPTDGVFRKRHWNNQNSLRHPSRPSPRYHCRWDFGKKTRYPAYRRGLHLPSPN